jgi:hypothetical protein
MMRKGYKGIVIALVLLVALTAGVSAQYDLSTLKSDFNQFSKDVATSLPFAATLGGSWSDAKVMSFPHFGAGLSVGTVTMPSAAFENLESTMGVSLPQEVKDAGLGVPFPGYTLDARMGLPMLPFDIGAKFGYMHPALGEAIYSLSNISADYMLAGIDIRYPIFKQKMLIPSISVSAGANYLTGGLSMPSGLGASTIDVSDAFGNAPGTNTIEFSDPDVRFAWESTTLDFRVQASEKLLLFTFYGGGGYSYGISSAGGGLSGTYTNNTGYSDAELQKALEDEGYNIQLSDQAFALLQSANGGSFHAFAGFSVDLLLLRLDLQGKYNFLTNHLGAGLNARIQL